MVAIKGSTRLVALLLLALTGAAILYAGAAAGLDAAKLVGVCMFGAGLALLLERRRPAAAAARP
jgi:hypothetical protein